MDSNKDSNRISRLLEEVSTPESSDNNEDPYHDDGGEYDSDDDYRPSAESDSSDDEIGFNGISARHRRRYHSSSSSDNNAPVSPSLQYPALQSKQPVAQGASDLLQPTDIDLSFQSPEMEQPGAQPANDNFHDMDIFVSSPEATDSEQLQNNEEWSPTTIPIADFHFEESSSGPRFDVNSIQTPLYMFKLVFPESLIDHIVECTNKYGEKLTGQGGPRTRNSRHYKFRPVDRQEILSVFGICLLQGQLKFPLRRNFFSNDPLYYHPFFQHVTYGRRFEQVIRCLCVADDQAKGEHKVLDFIKALNNNFQLIYGPSKELCIDESLILFRGRIIFRQYIKSKKARYGIKFYVLTTASGYVLDMIIYRGKDASAETGKKTQNIVLKLLEPYVLKGHHVFMDNFYNSVELSQKLLDLRTHSCGTLRKNRKGNPRDAPQTQNEDSAESEQTQAGSEEQKTPNSEISRNGSSELMTPSYSRKPTNKKRKIDITIDRAIKELKTINEQAKVQTEDEFDLFCKSLAVQLKKMPLNRALICQEKLQSAMTQERLTQMSQSFPEVIYSDSSIHPHLLSTSRLYTKIQHRSIIIVTTLSPNKFIRNHNQCLYP
ncbi:unnamed protein product [Parnassius apollo]|uniref:(apollo) hypothetical protein n=1 Tax=Parnassius apollo TaxID=110799 RepID=A0A8S3X4H7_PARAO|nr:unnamed protein product [Parnassius apollo]